jgi:Flp pilus assembly pilin Flp
LLRQKTRLPINTGGEIKKMMDILGTNQDKTQTLTAKQKQQKGVTTVEYAVMLVLVAIAVLAFGTGIANSVTNVFSQLASSLG